MKNFLKLIRIEQLTFIALVQLILKYTFLDYATVQALANWQYALLVVASLCIAAGGFIINDIFDVEVDAINRPNQVYIGTYFSEKTAYNWYFGLNIVGVGIGFYLSRVVERPSYAAIFIICSALYYVYSNGLKQIPIIGNGIVALLMAINLLVIGFFNLFPTVYKGNETLIMNLFSIIVDYAIMIFLLFFAQEILKTIKNKDGDSQYELTTVATSFGTKKALLLVSSLILILLAFIVYYLITNLAYMPYVIGYVILLMIAPLLFFILRSFQANTQRDFILLEKILKVVSVTTMLSLSVIVLVGYRH
ncbi:geranylgeranylglycerol-phosphate geranylgeranyltransferase [Flavobacterium sp. 20NA77.7]|uniref:Geranylgeranylglycerol-phosphate geranylgeranyltransferase n=1 Tax=Flavobacterium nakdongensis TaxID=3073563 RepID=A0ABY9RDT7_9FLAO|nr:geranylgeranylglycerol-phosphate geranylgeranyltransferase [Flavobacterium sp. 20NA77.7]WMW78810.1 geranylgeranylglycerol-phosphate geranylgeranyltransferase [Flavobacterium sp. 20NA77.7]